MSSLRQSINMSIRMIESSRRKSPKLINEVLNKYLDDIASPKLFDLFFGNISPGQIHRPMKILLIAIFNFN